MWPAFFYMEYLTYSMLSRTSRSSCISFLDVIIQAIITASHWAERVFLEYRVMGLTHRHRHQRCQLQNEWAESVETRGCWVGQWRFCFSDLCSWTHSPLQSRDLSQRLAKPWGDNFQGLSHEIPRQHPSRSRRAELEHSERADGGDCGKNRFRWGQTAFISSGLFVWICSGWAA